MEITYTLTTGDVLRFQKRFRQRYGKARLMLRWCIVLLYTAFVVALLVISPDKTSVVKSLALPLLAIVILWYVFLNIALRSQAKKTPGLGYPQTLRITPEHLVAIAPDSETKTRWHGVFDLFEDADYLFIMLNRQRGYIVPKSAFVSPVEQKRFAEAVMACWKAGKAGEAAPVIGESGAWPPPPRVGV